MLPRIKNRWLILGILTAGYTLSFMDRYVMNLMLDPIKHDLHLSDTQVSLLAGAGFAIFYAMIGLPLGWLADKKSRVALMSAGVAVWSLMTSSCGLARNYVQLLLARMGVGVGEAALSPSAYSLLADFFPKKNLATAIGIYSSGIYIGSGLAYIIGGMLLKRFTETSLTLPFGFEIFSWQIVFFLFGLPGLVIAVIVLFIREPERQKDRKRESAAHFLQFLSNEGKPFLLLCLASASFNIAVYATGVWIPTFLKRVHHMPLNEVGNITGLGIMLLSPIGVIAGGKIADMLSVKFGLKGRIQAVIVFVMLFCISCILYTLMSSKSATLFMLIPYALFVSTSVAVIAASVQEMVPVAFRGTSSAFLLFTQNIIGMSIGPTAVGLLTDKFFNNEMMLGHSLVLVSVASLIPSILLFIWCKRKIVNQ